VRLFVFAVRVSMKSSAPKIQQCNIVDVRASSIDNSGPRYLQNLNLKIRRQASAAVRDNNICTDGDSAIVKRSSRVTPMTRAIPRRLAQEESLQQARRPFDPTLAASQGHRCR
jgi:hypothetical protein